MKYPTLHSPLPGDGVIDFTFWSSYLVLWSELGRVTHCNELFKQLIHGHGNEYIYYGFCCDISDLTFYKLSSWNWYSG